MKNFYFFLIGVAAAFDIAANVLLKKSDGLKHLKFGIPALFLVCMAFTLLAQVTQEIDLTVAYISWGALAILGTAISGQIFLGQKLNWRGWAGIAMIIGSIIILKTA